MSILSVCARVLCRVRLVLLLHKIFAVAVSCAAASLSFGIGSFC